MPLSRRYLLRQIGLGFTHSFLNQGSVVNSLVAASTTSQNQRRADIVDKMSNLPPGTIHFSGFLERYIQSSITHWSKNVVPYRALADFFRTGRPKVKWDQGIVELFATGEMWGKAVRSAALFYRYTGDPELRALLKETVADLLSMRRSNGTLSCSPVEQQPDGPNGDLWERTYVLLALDDYYSFVESDPKVLAAMIDEADATVRQVGRGPNQVRIVDLGWSARLANGNNIESSTILEPIMRLYKRTRYERYLTFARYIVEDEGGSLHHRIFDEVLFGENPVDVGGVYPKAYEMTSLFEGLVEFYRVTGNDRWKKACEQYFHKLIEHEITVVGNGGGDQPFHPNVKGEAWDNTAFEQTNLDIHRMMETCTGVTWLKFCHQILRLTGDSIAADYIELYTYNGLIGAMKPKGDGFSYVNLLNGVKTIKTGWGTDIDGLHISCCNLNGPEGLGYLPLVAIMSDKSGPVINLYNAATVSIPIERVGILRLNIVTDYPVSGRVRIEVEASRPITTSIKLRIPAWSAHTDLKVCGVPTPVKPGTYVELKRLWRNSDVIELDLDMRTRVLKAKPGLHSNSGEFVALLRGPIVLARDENIDPHYADPVDIVADTESFADVKLDRPLLTTTNVQLTVSCENGQITVVDYASVDSWKGKRVQTWLPVKSKKAD
jgi:uncharacterized protein